MSIKLTEKQIADITPPGYEILPLGDEWVRGTRFLKGDGWHDTVNVFGNGAVIHIRPIPRPKLWWIDVKTSTVAEAAEKPTDASVEVTKEYAEYLRTIPPDGPWELRTARKGDRFIPVLSGGATPHEAWCAFSDDGPHDRCIRWCRPRPGIKWREVDVCLQEEPQVYTLAHPDTGSRVYWTSAASIPGYGGTWFDDRTDRWRFDVSLGCHDGCDGEILMRPLKVRFWRPAK